MRQSVRCTAVIALVVLAGCAADAARQRLLAVRRLSLGSWLPVQSADFADADPLRGKPTCTGSRALQDAALAHPGLAVFVRDHGMPNAIGIGDSARTIDLAYVDQRTAYTVDGSGDVTQQRALVDAEVEQIDPDHVLARESERLRAYLDGCARVVTVGRRMLLALPAPPAGTPRGQWYGVLLPKTSPLTARLYSHPADAPGRVVAWVHPEGPATGLLEPGDRVTAIDGTPTAAFDASGIAWEGTKTLTVERAGQSRSVVLEPEMWPRRLVFVVFLDITPNAGAVDGGIGVTTGLLDLMPSDDELAWIIGHELAHVTLGHTRPGVTAGSILKGIVGVGILLPAQIVVPGSGQFLGGLMQGVENRFNRDQERDADRLGVHYTRAAGYDPSAALAVMDIMQEKVPVGSVGQFLDIHPPYPERRELLASEIAAVGSL